jgi:hypothetical protein
MRWAAGYRVHNMYAHLSATRFSSYFNTFELYAGTWWYVSMVKKMQYSNEAGIPIDRSQHSAFAGRKDRLSRKSDLIPDDSTFRINNIPIDLRDERHRAAQPQTTVSQPRVDFQQPKRLRVKSGKEARYESDPTKQIYIKDFSGTDALAAGSLLDLLKETEPELGKPLSIGFFRSRAEAFRKYLSVSRSVRDRWNDLFRSAKDQGIVISAGRAGAILNAYVVLHTLRLGTNCSLPVVIAHYGEEEFKQTTREFFRQNFENIEFLDLQRVQYPEHHLSLDIVGNRREFGYKLKVFSIYMAPFREIIFLDADAIPLQDPATLFRSELYKRNGNIFWNDFWKDPVPLWQILQLKDDPWSMSFGEEHQSGAHGTDSQLSGLQDISRLTEQEWAAQVSIQYPFEAESGQILLDKVKYWEVLEWVMFLNTHDFFIYRYSMGDKDTFRVAFALAGMAEKYFSSPFGPALPLADLGEQGEAKADPAVRYRCLGMLQLHPETGTPFFHHRTADSKFHPLQNPKEYLSPITHVTPPITQDQASIMNWGNPGYSIFQASGRVTWGISSKSARLSRCHSIPLDLVYSISSEDNERLDERKVARGKCPCPPINLHTANQRCMGKDAIAMEIEPEPILVIEVPVDNFIYKMSQLEREAYNAIPFQEGSQD